MLVWLMIRASLVIWFLGVLLIFGQGAEDPVLTTERRAARDASVTSPFNRKDARAISLSIPAPRGLIADRFGNPLAQNKVSFQLALKFNQIEGATPAVIKEFADRRLEVANRFLEKPWEPSEEVLWEHYRHRRWLPLYNRRIFTEEEAEKMRGNLVKGLELLEIYTRHYPEKQTAAHILGFTRSTGPLPTGPVNADDPLWQFTSGARGLEKLYEDHLAGIPGRKRLMFDQDGLKLLEELAETPKPGGTLITTLDLKWQKKAESILQERTKAGALVVLDIVTGEVLVLASNPSFDPNEFGLHFDGNRYMELLDDKRDPLIGRAFQGVYPPASTFKPFVALAALEEKVINESTIINCPASVSLGNHTFRNWTTVPEGPISLQRAMARSTNPWFYIVCQRFSSTQDFIGLARRFGMGSKTGLPLDGEKAGIMPNDATMRRIHKRPFSMGDRLNMSIGQGPLLTTPLQIAQAMAGLANGRELPKLHLVRQLQDRYGNVVFAAIPEVRTHLGVDTRNVAPVLEGMHDVVHSGYGTGRSAGLSYTTMGGKTGTAQWGPVSQNRRLAWFGGFFPVDNPRFAFAALYEGQPNEKIGGGSTAGPIVREFFEAVKKDVENILNPPKAIVIVDEADAEMVARQDEDGTGGVEPGVQALEGEALDRVARRAVIIDPADGSAAESNEANGNERRAMIVELNDGDWPLEPLPGAEPGNGEPDDQSSGPAHSDGGDSASSSSTRRAVPINPNRRR